MRIRMLIMSAAFWSLLLLPFAQSLAAAGTAATTGTTATGTATTGTVAGAGTSGSVAVGTPVIADHAGTANAGGKASGAGGTASGQSYKTSFTETSLSGATVWSQQYFQIPDYWHVGSMKLELDYTASQLTQGSRSSVTLSMNGTPFYSFRPVVSGETKQHLSIPMPTEGLVKGVNNLTVEGSIQTAVTDPNQVCVPVEPHGSWLQLYDTSNINVQYANVPLKGTISDFNQRFLGLDTISSGLNAVVVPKEGDAAELEAAVYALSGLAKASSLKDKPIPLLEYGDDSLKTKKAVVLVSLYRHLPDAVRNQIGKEMTDGQALIRLIGTDSQPMLVVTSEDPQLLVRAGRLVANQSLMTQLNGPAKIVDETTDVATPPVSISRNVTLTDAGDKLTGEMHQEKTYFVSLPGNRSIADASKLSINFSYSGNLDFDRSLMTVLVNNAPIGSKKLSAEMADGDSINLTIPKNLNISGNFTVTAAFDLELKSAGCIQSGNQMPWAFVAKDSMLQINTKDRADLLFNNYPYPFLRDGSYNQVAVVLPEERDRYTYAALSNLFNLLGQFAATNTGDVQFFDDNVGADQLKDKQIIAIGTYRNNKIIRDNNGKLYFQYASDGTGFRSNEKMSIESDYGKRLGTLQLIDSPYGAGHGLMVVTGAGSEYYYLASKLVASEGKLFQVFGDGVATDKDGNVDAFRFKKEAEQEQPTFLSDVLDRSDVLSFIASIVLVMVLVLVSLILLIRKYRKKGRGSR